MGGRLGGKYVEWDYDGDEGECMPCREEESVFLVGGGFFFALPCLPRDLLSSSLCLSPPLVLIFLQPLPLASLHMLVGKAPWPNSSLV